MCQSTASVIRVYERNKFPATQYKHSSNIFHVLFHSSIQYYTPYLLIRISKLYFSHNALLNSKFHRNSISCSRLTCHFSSRPLFINYCHSKNKYTAYNVTVLTFVWIFMTNTKHQVWGRGIKAALSIYARYTTVYCTYLKSNGFINNVIAALDRAINNTVHQQYFM